MYKRQPDGAQDHGDEVLLRRVRVHRVRHALHLFGVVLVAAALALAAVAPVAAALVALPGRVLVGLVTAALALFAAVTPVAAARALTGFVRRLEEGRHDLHVRHRPVRPQRRDGPAAAAGVVEQQGPRPRPVGDLDGGVAAGRAREQVAGAVVRGPDPALPLAAGVVEVPVVQRAEAVTVVVGRRRAGRGQGERESAGEHGGGGAKTHGESPFLGFLGFRGRRIRWHPRAA